MVSRRNFFPATVLSRVPEKLDPACMDQQRNPTLRLPPPRHYVRIEKGEIFEIPVSTAQDVCAGIEH